MCPYWLSECETTSRADLRVKETYERANGSEYVSDVCFVYSITFYISLVYLQPNVVRLGVKPTFSCRLWYGV